jgi:3-oxoacyl-[acyl-carrier-protein] synthase II
MERKVVITGAGVISSLGDSPAELQAALKQGRSGLQPVELFSTEGLGCHIGGEVKSFSPQTYLGDKNFRPLDRTSQLVIAAAQLALNDSGWSVEMRQQHELGLVLGTMFCSVHTIWQFDYRGRIVGPGYASPMDFANTVINAAAGQTAIWHRLRGVNSTNATGAASGLQAISYATDLIRSGQATAILAGGVEELCFESFYGFYYAGLLCESADGAGEFPIPFDARRNGFALGEGAALLMLEDAESARQRGATVLAQIRGHGGGYDCSRGRDDKKSVEVITRAIRQALNNAQTRPEQIDGLSASANGSVLGDRHEALAVAAAFDGRAPTLPVTAIKSRLGETLGASGAMQMVAMLEAMREGVLPGIGQLEQTEADFPLLMAGADPQEIDLRYGLINSVGFDGHCCSLVLERCDG